MNENGSLPRYIDVSSYYKLHAFVLQRPSLNGNSSLVQDCVPVSPTLFLITHMKVNSRFRSASPERLLCERVKFY